MANLVARWIALLSHAYVQIGNTHSWRSVLIPQVTIGHPRTPQDVQIYIINMLFW